MRTFILICILSLTHVTTAQEFRDWTTHPNFDMLSRASIQADNDCSVIAFAMACDIPYHKSYMVHRDYFERCSPTDETRAEPFWNNVESALHSLHRVGVIVQHPDDESITVYQLAAKYPTGSIYVVVHGHALAIINGTVFNQIAEPCLGCEVLAAFEVFNTPPCD